MATTIGITPAPVLKLVSENFTLVGIFPGEGLDLSLNMIIVTKTGSMTNPSHCFPLGDLFEADG